MPSALLTGGRGFAGSHLAETLRAGGWQVRLFDGDIRQPDGLARFRGDAIFHLAAQSSPALSRSRPDETFDVNAIGTARLLEALAAARYRGRLIVVSTCEVYRLDPRPRRETDALAPRNPYGWSKLLAERVARARAELDVVIARPFNHTGPRQAPTFVCPSFARQVLRRRVVRVGQLGSVRDFMDVRDVVRAYARLATHGRRGETYNIASGRGRRIGEILETLVRLSGRKVRIEVDPALVRPADWLVGDPSKIAGHAGWRAEVPFDETLGGLLRDSL